MTQLAGFIEPIRMSTRVRRSLDDTFELFTGNLSGWWPSDRFTFGPGRADKVIMEPRVGGRFYERYTDGEEHTIGHVLAWNPPTQVIFTWGHHDAVAPTEVSVSFVAEDTMLTRVELEHRAWERLGVPGHETREAYANGWPSVIAAFTAAAGRP